MHALIRHTGCMAVVVTVCGAGLAATAAALAIPAQTYSDLRLKKTIRIGGAPTVACRGRKLNRRDQVVRG